MEKLPEGHLEVFELCEQYLQKNAAETDSAGAGSPRLPILRKSREKIEKLHKYHLLSWASLESRALIQSAKNQSTIEDNLVRARKALSVLDSAAQFYPHESLLVDSINAVREFILTVRINDWTEQAERAVYEKNYQRAISCYRDALFFLTRENEQTPERERIADKINLEIEKISEIANKGEQS